MIIQIAHFAPRAKTLLVLWNSKIGNVICLMISDENSNVFQKSSQDKKKLS